MKARELLFGLGLMSAMFNSSAVEPIHRRGRKPKRQLTKKQKKVRKRNKFAKQCRKKNRRNQ